MSKNSVQYISELVWKPLALAQSCPVSPPCAPGRSSAPPPGAAPPRSTACTPTRSQAGAASHSQKRTSGGHSGPKGPLRGPMRSSRWRARNSQLVWALANFERCPAQCANVLLLQSPPIRNGHGCVGVSGMLARRVPWGEAQTLTRSKRARSWRIQGPRSFSNVLRLAHKPNKKLEPELYGPTSTF